MRRTKRPPRSAQIRYGLAALLGCVGAYLQHGAWYLPMVVGGAGLLVSIAAGDIDMILRQIRMATYRLRNGRPKLRSRRPGANWVPRMTRSMVWRAWIGQSEGVTEMTMADQLVAAIRVGDAETVERLVASDTGLAGSPLGGAYGTRTPLHVAADWPGYWPNGPQIVGILLAAGADPNARDPRPRSESPLHWAASSDDADVARVLIDGGADINLPDGSIGTPLDNAIGYGCWNVARLLVERGAHVESLWVAAGLGMIDRLQELLSGDPKPDREELSQAFWHACAAGQRRAAELLLGLGADLNGVPDYANGRAPLDAAKGRGAQQENVVSWLQENGAKSSDDPE